MNPRVLILHASGTNRDIEAARAFELAEGQPEIVHLNQLRAKERSWGDYEILALPGGFSYADTLGAGRLLALDLQVYFQDAVQTFISTGKPVIGICNGFQALVRSGVLPSGRPGEATLTFNARGHFECRWVTLAPQSEKCLWTRGLSLVECPVAHGEGNFALCEPGVLDTLRANDQIALVYARADGAPALGEYPSNPNGSLADIAGICNPQGNVLGLMPHPEDHVSPFQHPQWTRGGGHGLGLALFENGVRFASQM